MESLKKIEYVASSTRVRLARNLADYPFPNRLNERQAKEIQVLVSDAIVRAETLFYYPMNIISEERGIYFKEKNLISQTLLNNRRIAGALISKDESISIMINEEDHIRAQYFLRGFDLENAYEKISGIDDILSQSLSFAYDDTFGYLTACPTNLGTGLRASVMLFLPALTRRKRMPELISNLVEQGLTVRGVFGEGSGTEGEMYQISNEVTLGQSEEEIIATVKDEVTLLIDFELLERDDMLKEDEAGVIDEVMRSYGILAHCYRLSTSELLHHMANVKLGVATGILSGSSMEELDRIIRYMRPANLEKVEGKPLNDEERGLARAFWVKKLLRQIELVSEK